MLDLALTSGTSPSRLLDEDVPDVWTVADLEVVSQWKTLKDTTCPGCGRPLSQHLKNDHLGREEEVSDYVAYSFECPSQKAISEGQDMWRKQNKAAIDKFQAGNAPDPGMGLYWLSQGPGESIPQP